MNFNSRPCERGDPTSFPNRQPVFYFNSRPCERGDAQGEQRYCHSGISILAPARGATLYFPNACICIVFQFSPLREGRLPNGAAVPFSIRFQFSPLREGRPRYITVSDGQYLFQFSPLREGRPTRYAASAASSNFNSRPCERGDVTTIFLLSI